MTLIELIRNTMEDLKANDVIVVDFKNTSPLYDAFVICDAQSQRQVNAIADAIEKKVIENGYQIKHQANRNDGTWQVVDAIDVVAHVFTSDERHHYDLDKLYKEFIRE